MKMNKAALCVALMFFAALVFSQSSEKVCVTEKGKKYHTISCRTIKNSAITKLAKDEAVKLGYEPCKVCKP